MLTRPVSCGVTATIDAMTSKELAQPYSPFDMLYDDQPVTPVMWLHQDDQVLPREIREAICEA